MDSTAGPGQNPLSPQPTPNRQLPATRGASIWRAVGSWNDFSRTGRESRFCSLTPANATDTAPPSTNTSDGFQSPARSRNARTVAGLAIPPRIRPMLNARPHAKAAMFLSNMQTSLNYWNCRGIIWTVAELQTGHCRQKTPTRNPAGSSTYHGVLSDSSGQSPVAQLQTTGPVASPARNAASGQMLSPDTTRPIMPLIPATRPSRNRYAVHASPITAPPAKLLQYSLFMVE
ncbi:hypothetical protein KL912_003860 [Ogataea haglerorum]|nr:hypothetical protein KL923_004040 [Ogataea haglerorum]KAG7746731.1 hypothetical protein KL912_003860 [Ogataea haglerorum]